MSDHSCAIVDITNSERVLWYVSCPTCGRVGQPQLFEVDAMELADRHELIDGFDNSARMAICRDEDCPQCGWPETYAEGPANSGPDILGCRKCGWQAKVAPR